MAITQRSGIATYVSDWWKNLTLVTKIIISVCVSIYAYSLLFGIHNERYCILPHLMVSDWTQEYRLVTSMFLHGGLLHLFFNMIAFQPMGCSLERKVGSLEMLWMVFLLGIIGGMSIVFISYSLAWFYSPKYLFQCTIGFSGVLFSLVTIETHFNPVNYSLWGLASVPAKYYPWILLILAQFLMSGVSFIGHLSGILIGYAYAYGFLKWLIPSPEFFNKIESSRLLAFFVKRDGYITHPSLGSRAVLPTTTTMNERATNDSSNSSSNAGILSKLKNAYSSSTSPAYQPFSGLGHTLGSSITPSNNNNNNNNNNSNNNNVNSPITQTNIPKD